MLAFFYSLRAWAKGGGQWGVFTIAGIAICREICQNVTDFGYLYNGRAGWVKSGIFLDFPTIGQGAIFRGFWMATSDLGGIGVNFSQLWGHITPQPKFRGSPKKMILEDLN